MDKEEKVLKLIQQADSEQVAGNIDNEIDLRLQAFVLTKGLAVRPVAEIERVAHLICDLGDQLENPSSDKEWEQATSHAQRRHGLIEGAIIELVKAEQPERAFSITQRVKSPFLVRRLRAHTRARHDLSPIAGVYRDLLAEKDSIQHQIRQARRDSWDHVRMHSLQAKDREIQNKLTQAEQRLRSEDPKALAGFGAPLHPDDLLPLFPADGSGCLVDLFFGGNETIALLAFRDGAQVNMVAMIQSALNLPRLVKATERWFAALASGDFNKANDELLLLATFLHDRLMCGLGQYLRSRGHWRVMIIPHIMAHALPLHLAPLCETNYLQMFWEQFAVSYAPCVQLALTTALRPRPVEFIKGNLSALLVSDPFEDLPAARFEQQAVATQLAEHPWGAAPVSSEQIVGSYALREHVETALPNAGLISLATHANFRAGDPYGSGLYLAGDNKTIPKLWSIDQVYTSTHLQNQPIVILSACESGMVYFDESVEAVAVPSAFISIGAAAVLASLWPVEDVSTSFLVERFVHHLLDPGETPATALSVACQEMKQVTREQALERIDEILVEMEARQAHFGEGGDAYLQLSGLRVRIATGSEQPFASPMFWGGFFVAGCGWRAGGGKVATIRKPEAMVSMMEAIVKVKSASKLFEERRYKECSDILREATPALDGRWLGRALLMLGDAIYRQSQTSMLFDVEASERQLNEAMEILKRAFDILTAQGGDQEFAHYCEELIMQIKRDFFFDGTRW